MPLSFDCLMFIGDPHLAARGPGSRIDDFRATGLNKLRQAFTLARQYKAWPIITGDLFHRAVESDPLLMGELFNLLWEFRDLMPCCSVGNHDKREFTLKAGTALQLVFNTRLLTPLDIEGFEVEVSGETFRVVGLDHGDEFPKGFSTPTILVTHHDLAFPDCGYPGTQPIPAIPGVVLGVNGHIHKASPAPVKVDDAEWYNPGNILRVSRGEITNEPGVLLWSPLEGGVRVLLDFKPATEVFQTITKASDLQVSADAETPATPSLFGALVAAEGELGAQKTSDGSFLQTVMNDVLDAAEAAASERQGMAALMAEATAD